MDKKSINKVKEMLDEIDIDDLYVDGPLNSSETVTLSMLDSDDTIVHTLRRFLASRAIKDNKMEYYYYLLTRSDNDLYNYAVSNHLSINVYNSIILKQLFEFPEKVDDEYRYKLYRYIVTESYKYNHTPFKNPEDLNCYELVFDFMISESKLKLDLSAIINYRELNRIAGWISEYKGSSHYDMIASEVKDATDDLITAFRSCNPRMVLVKAAILTNECTYTVIREFISDPSRSTLFTVIRNIGLTKFLTVINSYFNSIKLPR